MFSQSLLKGAQLGASSLRNFSLSHQDMALKQVTVIGAGLMGSGITQVSAQAGYDVTLVDTNDQILAKSINSLSKSLDRISKKKFADDISGAEAFKKDTLARIKTSTDASSAAKSSDLIIEAIVENVDIKCKLFETLEATAPSFQIFQFFSHTIFATNTSSIMLKDITSIKRQDKWGGLHFFNPVPMMKLLEVVRTSSTSEETFQTLCTYGKSVGKTTVTCKDTPGFIVNRLLVPYMMEALRMAERGDASPRDIDTAMKLGAGYPMGPFELSDYVGLDTTKFIIDGWNEQFPDDPLFKPSKWLDRLVKEGKLGRKSGEGFYQY